MAQTQYHFLFSRKLNVTGHDAQKFVSTFLIGVNYATYYKFMSNFDGNCGPVLFSGSEEMTGNERVSHRRTRDVAAGFEEPAQCPSEPFFFFLKADYRAVEVGAVKQCNKPFMFL